MENWKTFFDCEIFWNAGKINLPSLAEILNSIHPAIQFIMEIRELNLPFLDIIIHRDRNKIWKAIYSKPTDSKWYLPFNSNHPKNCLKTYPFVQREEFVQS